MKAGAILSALALAGTLAIAGCEDIDDVAGPDLGVDAESFAEFDADLDGLLTEEEFDAGLETAGLFHRFDADVDGTLDEEEFRDDWGAYGDWDQDLDARVDEDEFLDGVFGMFDEDVNDFIDEEEFGTGLDMF